MKEVRREMRSLLILLELDHLHFIGIRVHFSIFEYLDELKKARKGHFKTPYLDIVEVAVVIYRRLSQEFVDLVIRVPVASSH